jgi:hypothetical protein
MTFRRRFLYLGVFLVAVGGVALAALGNVVGDDALAQALRLWPFALVALGAGLVLRHTRLALGSGLVAAAMPGLLLGGLLVHAPRLAPACGAPQPGSVATRQGSFDGPASVDLRLACGDLTVTTAPGSGWQFEAGDPARTSVSIDDSANRLSVTSSGQWRAFDPNHAGETWKLTLPAATPLDLAAEVDAGRGRFDLAGAQLGNVQLAVNAGDARVDLGAATVGHLAMTVNAASATLLLPATGDYSGSLSVNAGSLRLCSASASGVRIHATATLASTTFTGLVHDGDAWQSPGYATATSHADLAISATLGSVYLNPAGGCE